MCNDLYHAACTGDQDLKLITAGKPHEWTCLRCELTKLPFFKCHQDDIISQYVDDDLTCGQIAAPSSAVNDSDIHLQSLVSRANQVRIAHLKTQSMVSSFGELQATLAEYPINILTMSETWLKNNPHLLSYVAISCNPLLSNFSARQLVH